MSRIIPNSFTSYAHSEEEQLEGQILNYLQKECIQNLVSTTAQVKLNLVFDSEHPLDFGQQVSYQQGKLDALNYILQLSEAAEEEKRTQMTT